MNNVWRSPGWLLVGLLAVAASGQQSDAEKAQDPMSKPTELGIRFTPGMAQGMAQFLIEDVMGPRYELPAEQRAAAIQAVARRMMEIAHAYDDGSGAESAEGLLKCMLRLNVEGNRRRPWEMGREFAESVGPLIPGIRELVTRIGQDIRPMLSVNQQLKLGMDIGLTTTALDAFETRMKNWADGQIQPGEDPFGEQQAPVRDPATGESSVLKTARRVAQSYVDQPSFLDKWQRYVADAKRFYRFDEAQAGSADSVLRETVESARQIMAGEEWRTRMYRNRMWNHLSWTIPGAAQTPIRSMLEAEQGRLMEPLTSLGELLKRRIAEIPTEAQRQAADQQVQALLNGLGVNNELGHKDQVARRP